MEMLEDVLDEVVYMENEKFSGNYIVGNPYPLRDVNRYLQMEEEIIRNRKDKDRWIPDGYMTIEEGKALTLNYLKSFR
ncbi:hypothetical protein FACS189434_05930 [Bacteroidia bacterium]|nr:hypothetical protein FACS189434_05930 [Bacteroidia bacterium]